MKQVRLSKQNEDALIAATKGTLVPVSKAANRAISLGLEKLLRQLGKKGGVR